jgi:hypothetical protein
MKRRKQKKPNALDETSIKCSGAKTMTETTTWYNSTYGFRVSRSKLFSIVTFLMMTQ